MQVIIHILDDEGEGVMQYDFPETDEGRAAILSLRSLMRDQAIDFETVPDNSLAIKVSGYGPIAFVRLFLEEMEDQKK